MPHPSLARLIRAFVRSVGRPVLATALIAAPLAAQLPRAVLDTSALAGLQWREIGPYRGGRSVAVAGSSARPHEYWMGTTGGGVFKTTDGGLNWVPVTDRFFGGTIGAIGVSESNPDVVYVGAGEFPIRGNVSHGDGVYKTTDGGRTWTYVGLVETRQISRVRVHPKNPDVVWVGAQGHVWAPNAERGVFKTTDGGRSWRKVLFRNDSTGVTDLALDPSDPMVLYAALWQAGRTPWQLVSGGPGSGLFKSTDGGETWTEITRNPGLPKTGLIGNSGITVSGGNSKRVWAIVEHDSGGVFRSDDGGATWTKVNDERKLRQRAWYYSRVYADPKDTNVVYASNVSFQKSTDGGRTWTAIRTPHGDSHDLWIAPNDPRRMIEGNDGGANVSVNGGRSWTDQDFATAQFYHVTTTNHFPYRVCGAQQDNSTVCGPSRKEGGIEIGDWVDAGGCESGYIAARPDDPDVTYAGCYGGYLSRKDARTGLERNITPWPLNPMGHSAGELQYRFQWTYPIVVSPHDPSTLYATGNVVFRSRDEGASWEIISKDLTRADPKTLGPSGGPITKDQTSVEYYATIFAFAESPRTKGVLWAGSDDGLVHLSRDGGATWTDVTPKEMRPFTRVSLIEPGQHAPGTAYVAANRFQLDDHAPYIWKTTDYGASWTRADAGIAAGEFVRAVREDPEREGLLYAGTERGVWTSLDGGASWQRLQRNLPPVPVHDLVVKDGDLVVGTHGRSFWILDDLSVLRQRTAEIAAKRVHLYRPREAYRIQWGQGGGGQHPVGQNPPSGAVVRYHLASAADTVTLEVLDSTGTVIRRFTSLADSLSAADSARAQARADSVAALGVLPAAIGDDVRSGPPSTGDGFRRSIPPRLPARAGLNTFVWNLRGEDARGFRGMILWAGGLAGPVVPPGRYTLRLTAADVVETQPLVVRKDPRSAATAADLAAQYSFLLQVRDRTSEANDGVRTVRNVRAQLAARVKSAPKGRAAGLQRAGDALLRRLGEVEEALYQTRNRSGQDPLNYPIRLNNEIAALAGVAASTEAAPTAQTRQVFDRLDAQLTTRLGELRDALARLLPPVNAELARLGLAAITPSIGELESDASTEEQELVEEDLRAKPRRW